MRHHRKGKHIMRKVRTLIVAQGAVLLSFTLFTGSVQGGVLTGTGPNLLIPGSNPGAPPSEIRTTTNVTTLGFTGSWTAAVLPAWFGSFTATGPIPASVSNPAGLTRYDFSGMANGVLAAGTFFRFGDVDGGSNTNEKFELQAFGTGGAILTPWLDEAIGVIGSGTGSGGSILPIDLPKWDFNFTTGVYTFDGATVTNGNPSVGFYLPSNVDITMLDVNRFSSFENFVLAAPIPTPGTAVVLGLSGIVLVRRRR